MMTNDIIQSEAHHSLAISSNILNVINDDDVIQQQIKTDNFDIDDILYRIKEISNQEIPRKIASLLRDLGANILRYVFDKDVNEIYVNEDHLLRIDTIYGRKNTGDSLDENKVRTICTAISGINDEILNELHPKLSVEIESLNIRAQIEYPPIVKKPTFMLRKKPVRIFTLDEYEQKGFLSPLYRKTIKYLIENHKNIVIAGGTGSGKTTFLNGVLNELAILTPYDRIIMIEDLPELICPIDDKQNLLTSGNRSVKISARDLVKDSMRLSPTRIIVGEIRDHTAHDMLKAWNTGHEGGFCTVHSNSAVSTLGRIESLVLESDSINDYRLARSLIGDAIHAVISIQKFVSNKGTYRIINDIIFVDGYDKKNEEFIITNVTEEELNKRIAKATQEKEKNDEFTKQIEIKNNLFNQKQQH